MNAAAAKDAMQTDAYRRPVVVALRGDLDFARAEELQKLLEPALFATDVILDMTGTAFLDCACLGILVGFTARRQKTRHSAPRIVLTNPHVRRVLAITRTESLWSITPSLDQVLARRDISR